jgi:hypothetical protein
MLGHQEPLPPQRNTFVTEITLLITLFIHFIKLFLNYTELRLVTIIPALRGCGGKI